MGSNLLSSMSAARSSAEASGCTALGLGGSGALRFSRNAEMPSGPHSGSQTPCANNSASRRRPAAWPSRAPVSIASMMKSTGLLRPLARICLSAKATPGRFNSDSSIPTDCSRWSFSFLRRAIDIFSASPPAKWSRRAAMAASTVERPSVVTMSSMRPILSAVSASIVRPSSIMRRA